MYERVLGTGGSGCETWRDYDGVEKKVETGYSLSFQQILYYIIAKIPKKISM